MADEDNVVDPPEEAHDPRLSSAEKDAFFANDQNAAGPAAQEPTPERPPAQGYEVRFRSSTVEDADFEAPEQNAKEVSPDE